VEEGIQKFRSQKDMEIYIGKENPFSKEQDFSIMISEYSFEDQEQGFMALVGPKRMAYQKNIGLLHSLRKALS
jgi:heat-inducible transcriptional repressor